MKKIIIYVFLFLPWTGIYASDTHLSHPEKQPDISRVEPLCYDPASIVRLFREKDAWVDSLYRLRLPQVLFTGLDTLFTRYSREGFQAVKEPLHNYYNHIVDHLPAAGRRDEWVRMKAVVDSIGDPALAREADYMEVMTLPDDTEEETEFRLQQYEALAQKYEIRGDVEIEMRALRYIFLTRERQNR